MDPTKQQSVRQEFDKLFNMSPAEMQTHFSSEASDMASLSPKISKRAGVTHGKRVLALKQKPDWGDDDYAVAGTATSQLKFQLGRKARYADAEGNPTLMTIALRNRGHDPLKSGAPVVFAEAEMSLDDQRNAVRRAVEDFIKVLLPAEEGPDSAVRETYVWAKEVFSTYVVAEIERDGVLYKVNYAWVNGEVVIDPDITEVEIDYVPVVVHGDDAPDDGVLTEIAEAEGEDKIPVWTGIMMRASKAINRSPKNGKRKEYPAAVLQTAVAEGVFNDVPALYRDDDEHVDLKKTTTKIGMWGKAKWDVARQAEE